MRKLRDKLISICEKHESFGYYDICIDEAEDNMQIKPDICIEACKSLIEGVSKQIQKSLNPQLTERDFNGRGVTVQSIFGNATSYLAEYAEDFEEEFIRKFSTPVMAIGQFRNKRGDISHGRLIPKEAESSSDLALCICQVTEALVLYMLNTFENVDLSITRYEDCEDYNKWLDEDNGDNFICYSQALYEQNYDAYIEGFESFKLGEEEDDDLLRTMSGDFNTD